MSETPNLPSKQFMKSISSGELKDISSDAGEALLDSALDDGTLKDLPLVGWVFKAASVYNKTQDYFFAKKLYKFLFALKDISTEEREAFSKKLAEGEKEKEVGEKVLFLLGQSDEVDKAEIQGNLFRAYMKDRIDLDGLHRAMIAVNKVYLGDLTHIRKCRGGDMVQGRIPPTAISSFLNAGIIHISGTDTGIGGSGAVQYKYSSTAFIIDQHGMHG